ncbi:hypothetical protein B0H34DRAFT_670722 [Crassisporium funariophilum]|nr:hypothetical protein B0H34DRAFT_670722 [Crassisporium funariophilum]
MSYSDIEDPDLALFVEDGWIGRGRTVPDPENISVGLENYFATAKEVPDNVKLRYYPSNYLTVQQFLQMKYPKRTYSVIDVFTKKSFSKEPPNTSQTQAVLDGMVAVTDPKHPDSCLPLWMIEFWTKIWQQHDIHDQWEQGLKWLEREELLRVNDSCVGLFSERNLDSSVAVKTLRLWQELNKAKSASYFTKSTSRFVSQLEKQLKEGEIDYLFFPVYLDTQQHWLVFGVDVESRKVSYGDPLTHKGITPPKECMKKVMWWLKERIGKQFKDVGDELEHGEQNDFTDCGIVAVNTAAHEVFGDELWTDATKSRHCVQWFLMLAKKHMEEMSIHVTSNPNQRSYPTPSTNPLLPTSEKDPPASIAALLNPSSPGERLVFKMEESAPPTAMMRDDPETAAVMMLDDPEIAMVNPQGKPKVPAIGDLEAATATVAGHGTWWSESKKRPALQAINTSDQMRKALKASSTGNAASRFRSSRFKIYWPGKVVKLPAGGMKCIDTFFTKAKAPAHSNTMSINSQTSSPEAVPPPCPGLDMNIDLERTGALGGGAPLVTKLALEIYGKDYRQLLSMRQIQVKTVQMHEWTWRNLHNAGKVLQPIARREVFQ